MSSLHAKAQIISIRTESGREWRLDRDRIVIGSVESADVRLEFAGGAPVRAVIERRLDDEHRTQCLVFAVGEIELRINGAVTLGDALRSGDELTIGEHRLRVWLGAPRAEGGRFRAAESSLGQTLYIPETDEERALLLESAPSHPEPLFAEPEGSALEVVALWRSRILEVIHFVRSRRVTLGSTRGAHFIVPANWIPGARSRTYALVTRSARGTFLNLAPGMRGTLHSGGRTVALSGAGGRTATEAQAVPLADGDYARISVGEASFFVRTTAAPPLLRRRGSPGRDRLLLQAVGSSLAATLGVISLFWALPKPAKSTTDDLGRLPERIATVLYQPERYSSVEPPPPVPRNAPTTAPTPRVAVRKATSAAPPRPVVRATQRAPEVGQARALEGAGARARGASGVRGLPDPRLSASAEPAREALRPSPQGGVGRGSGASRVPRDGNVDLLKGAGARIEALLGNAALQGRQGGDRAAGFGGFSTRGSGGLALSGRGVGGGGNAVAIGGLSDRGAGGGRVGTGIGASGTGAGLVGGESRIAIQAGGPEESVVMGSIDLDAIERAILKHKAEIRLCYEREINAGESALAGKVVPTFTIGPSGRITEIALKLNTVPKEQVGGCVMEVLKRIDFPLPRGGGEVTVTYPFTFAPVQRSDGSAKNRNNLNSAAAAV